MQPKIVFLGQLKQPEKLIYFRQFSRLFYFYVILKNAFFLNYFNIKRGYKKPIHTTISAPPIRVEMEENANRLILSPAVSTARSPEPPMLQQQRPAVIPAS